MSILNVARIGKFSSDRFIRDYCQDIWKVEPGQVEVSAVAKTQSKAKKIPAKRKRKATEKSAGEVAD